MHALFGVPWGNYLGALWNALLRTVEFTIAGFIGSILLGMIIAVLRTINVWPLKVVTRAYVETFKNLPLITEIYIIYFGLASVGIRFNVFVAGTLSLVIFYAAYMSEVFRGGIEGVQPRQMEAGQALGLSSRSVLWVILLPQAVRLALPGTGTMMVDLLKGTSLMVTIGGAELMTEGTLIVSDTFRPLPVYIVVGIIYFALCFPLSRLVARLERRLAAGRPLSWRRARLLRELRAATPLSD